MEIESVHDIIQQMIEHNGLCVSPLFCYNEDGGVNFGDLIERLDRANKREMAELHQWRKQALEEDECANLNIP